MRWMSAAAAAAGDCRPFPPAAAQRAPSAAADRLARWPVGDSSRPMTRIGPSADTRRRHLPLPVAQGALQAVAAGLQIRRRQRPDRVGIKRQRHRGRARLARIVGARHRDLDRVRAGVDEPQEARLAEVAGGVEEVHPVLAILNGRQRVHAGHEPIVQVADVGRRHPRPPAPSVPAARRPRRGRSPAAGPCPPRPAPGRRS